MDMDKFLELSKTASIGCRWYNGNDWKGNPLSGGMVYHYAMTIFYNKIKIRMDHQEGQFCLLVSSNYKWKEIQ